jgi:CheY-like chemotaxis protein
MKGKILLVDDTEFYRKTYSIKLTTEGYLVSAATNGVEALKAIATEKPDLVLLDLVMPVMDGFKVLQAIKADPNLQSIPVVVFSAKGVQEEISKAISVGATDFLIKATTTPNKVVEKIKTILGHR